MYFSQFITEMLSWKCPIKKERFWKLRDILNVKSLWVLLKVVLPELNAKLGALIRFIVTVDSSHSMATGHAHTRDFPVGRLKVGEEVWIVNVVLC